MVNAIKKYGWHNIRHEILFEGLTKEEAELKEIELIAYYNSNNIKFGYNIEKGGSAKGKISEETRRKIGEAHKGEKHHFYGKHRSEEVKQKIRETKLGTKMSEEAKRKISKALIGKKLSDKTKKRMSESKSGERHPMYGKLRPEETRAKVWKAVRCIETEQIYKSITQASIDTGVSPTGISKVCLGKQKTSGGYHWEFVK